MPDWRHAIERRLAPLRLAPTREAEVVEELAQHLDDRYEEMRAAGVPDDEARRHALAELDDADLVRELTGIAPPAAEPLALGGAPQVQVFGGVWQDIRFGARLLVKDAGASFVIVLTLGLAIAANTIVFGITDLLLLRPLPIGNTDRLVTIYVFDPRQGQDRQRANIRDYLEIRAQSTLFEDVLAMQRGQQVSLTGAGDPLAVAAAPVTANLFHLWQVAPFAGRLLLPGDDVPGRGQVAVLAHRFWKAHFAGDPAIVGRAVTLNGRSYSVVGIVTPEVEIGNFGMIDVWLPLDTSLAAIRDQTIAHRPGAPQARSDARRRQRGAGDDRPAPAGRVSGDERGADASRGLAA